MATERTVRRLAGTDEGQAVLEQVLRGELDEDLGLLIHNMQRRLSYRTRAAFRPGMRVRIAGLTGVHARFNGKEGEVVKVNPKTVALFLDEDLDLIRSTREWDTETPEAQLKRELASVSVTPGALEVIRP